MIVPSIDIQEGRVVQLVGGRELALQAGDPAAVAERLSVAGELAVIDLDAAMGIGGNHDHVRRIVRRHACRVGGGIRKVEDALGWLDLGARRVILGTSAVPEVLAELPRERVIAAVDGLDGEEVVAGWRESTGRRVLDRICELRDLVGGFLVTFVEREGRMGGIDLAAAREVVEAAGGVRVTLAGGITTPEEIAALDRMGADAQVGMALYTGRLSLADALTAPLNSEREDGLWPTVVCDERGVALGLAWSSAESFHVAVERRQGVYHSRSRGLWVKGATSGASQELLRIDLDCDRDALRFVVRQHGPGFCHRSTRSCWGEDAGLGALTRRLAEIDRSPKGGSFTAKLLRDPGLLADKLVEEAGELGRAAARDEVVWEAADLLYFTLVRLTTAGVSLDEVERELDRRRLEVRRRDGSRRDRIPGSKGGAS